MKKLALLMVVMFCSAICFAQSSDPLAKGEDFVRICIRSDYGHQAIESGGDSAKVAACNMYVWGIVSGVNLYSSLSPQDILAAKKRGEASSYGVGSLEAMRKTADSFNLLCVPDEVTVGQLRSIVSSYITKHLDRSIWSTATLTYYAVTEAFPCTVKSPPQP